MKITIAGVVAGPAWGTEVNLTVGLAQSPERLIYNGANVSEMVEVLRGTAQAPLDRGNQASVLTFRFTNDNASTQASENDLILYFATLPRFGKITFYAETALTTPYAYMVGSVSIAHSQIGVATIRTFTIRGGPITTTVPAVPRVFPS